MPRKTRKVSRKHRRRTLRRIPRHSKKGGADSQAVIPPDSAFGPKIGVPIQSIAEVQKIA